MNEREENEKNINKIFIFENALIKKDNIITALRRRLDKLTETEEKKADNTDNEKETFVVEPSLAMNTLHDELILYKNCYENLSSQYKQIKISKIKLQKLVTVRSFLIWDFYFIILYIRLNYYSNNKILFNNSKIKIKGHIK